MNIIDRVKNVLISPKTEWPVIDGENTSHVKVLTTYVALLALIPAIASFIGYGIIGYNVLGFHFASIGLGIRHAIIQYITMVGGVYLTALVIDLLAANFGSQKNFDKAFSLVAYAYTPAFVGGIFYFYHPLGILASLASIYSLYLLYIGLAPMMKTPSEKQTSYFVVSLLVMLAAFFVLSLVLGAVLLSSTAFSF
ncbi:MAG: YIP1 family protein [Bacteroidetes bacterium]|nr:YIP1 family protein [Bacteroidota bacterium]